MMMIIIVIVIIIVIIIIITIALQHVDRGEAEQWWCWRHGGGTDNDDVDGKINHDAGGTDLFFFF